MWGEVLAAFVGAISGGAVLALLSLRIYKKEKLASALKVIYKLESTILADHQQLYYLYVLSRYPTPNYERIPSADLIADIRISLSEIKAIVRAHSPSAMFTLESLNEEIENYMCEREYFIGITEDADVLGGATQKRNYSEVTTASESMTDKIRLLVSALEQPQLPQIYKRLLYINPERWGN